MVLSSPPPELVALLVSQCWPPPPLSAVPVRDEDVDPTAEGSNAETAAAVLDLELVLEVLDLVTPRRASSLSEFARPARATSSRSDPELDRFATALIRPAEGSAEEEEEGALAHRERDSLANAGSWEGLCRRWAAAAMWYEITSVVGGAGQPRRIVTNRYHARERQRGFDRHVDRQNRNGVLGRTSSCGGQNGGHSRNFLGDWPGRQSVVWNVCLISPPANRRAGTPSLDDNREQSQEA